MKNPDPDNKNEKSERISKENSKVSKSSQYLGDELLTPSMRRKGFVIFFFLMTLNNLSYEVILCYSNDLAIRFDQENLMSAFSGCLVLFGIASRIFNTGCLLRIKHRYKNWMVVSSFVIGVVLMLLADKFDQFWMTLVATTLIGVGTSLGDSTNVGFIKGLPPIVSAGHSSGTGLSGIIGSTFYLLLKIFNFSFRTVNLTLLIFYPIYAFIFWRAVCFKKEFDEKNSVKKKNISLKSDIKMISSKREKNEYEDDESESNEPFMKIENNSEDIEEKEDNKDSGIEMTEDQESKINENLTWTNLKTVLPKCYQLVLGYFLMYFLEYINNSWVTSRIILNYTCEYDMNPPFFIKYGFELALVFYRFCLFFGRSSLSFFKCPRYWPLIVILAGMTIFYFAQSMMITFFPIPVMYVLIMVIAFIGGLLFCNLIYLTLKNPKLPKKQKEISLNLVVIMGDVGVLCSSLLGILVSTLFYRPLNC